MTCSDERFRHAVGPYLLGALDEAERVAFDAHLVGCTDCRAELAQLRPVVQALGTVSESDVSGLVPAGAAPPDTLLPGLLTRAARRDRRRRLLLAVAGGIAAAAVAALAVVLVTDGSGGSPGSPPGTSADGQVMAMSPLDGGAVRATATVTGMPWGTKITLHCHYQTALTSTGGSGSAGTGGPGGVGGSEYPTRPGASVYSLRVIDTAGSVHDVGSWAVAGGQDTVFTGGTSVPMGQIGRIDVVAADGSTVLTAAG